MRQFIKIWPDGLLSTDIHKGKRRLILSCHGTYDAVEFGGHVRDVYQLIYWLGEYADINIYEYIHIQSCHSGLGGRHSMACKISRIIRNKFIKGYKDGIYGCKFPEDYHSIENSVKQNGLLTAHDIELYRRLNSGNPLIDKGYGYHSVTYRNGTLLKETMDGDKLV